MKKDKIVMKVELGPEPNLMYLNNNFLPDIHGVHYSIFFFVSATKFKQNLHEIKALVALNCCPE